MRKWKCVSVNEENRDNFTVGKIYETDDKMLNCETDNGYVLINVRIIEKGDVEGGLVFGEVKEEEKKVNKFKVGDVVEIKDGNDIENYTAGWSYKMRGNIGKKAKISSIEERDGMPCYRLCDFNYEKCTQNCVYDERGLELVEYPKSKTLTITTSDSTTTLTDGVITVSVNRYHTDKHDEEVAIREVTDKYYEELARIEREKNTPKVGDKVRVVDDERVYSRYDDWIVENKIDIKYALLWQENYSPKNESTGFIRAIYPHLSSKDVILALVETESHAYIINIEGLEVIK